MSAPAFTEADVTKAVSGATKAGFTITRIDIDRHSGRISLYAGEAQATTDPSPESADDEIARWLDHDRRLAEGRP